MSGIIIRTVPNVMGAYGCSAETAQRYIDLRDEGHGTYQAKLMDGSRPCGLCLGLGCRMCDGTGKYQPEENIASLTKWLIANGHDESRLQRILALCATSAPNDWQVKLNAAQVEAYAEGRKDEREHLESIGALRDCTACDGIGEREVFDTSSGPDGSGVVLNCPDCDGSGFACSALSRTA